MKYGVKYSPEDESLVKNFENENLNMNMTDGEINMNNMISENIPKKVKRPEFQVISDNNLTKPSSSNNNNNISSSNFTYSSLTNNQSSSSLTNKLPSIIDDAKQIPNLISTMKKETKIEPRILISNLLNKIDSKFILDRFVQLNGNSVLGYWIEDCKEDIESGDRVDNRIYTLLTNLLKFCDNLPITVGELKTSKIGKKINKLGKCVSDRVIKMKCEELVSRWKKLIENIKDKKKDKEKERDREDESFNARSLSPLSPTSSDRNLTHSSSNLNSSSMLKKSKRDSVGTYGNSSSYSSSSTDFLEYGVEKNNKKYITIHYLFLYTMFIKFTHNSLSNLLK